MNLVIIEGIGKKDTIKKYLGSGFEVFASGGHVRDLPARSLAVDIENNFEPKYTIMPDKKKIVTELKEKAAKASNIFLATDPDREGEAISWHLCHILGIKENNANRIVFNEISKKAIEKALESPRAIDRSLVDAQQARRVLDRLVGYQLSPYLMRRIAHKGLSAGRVQSAALRIVCDREAEIKAFVPVESYLVAAALRKKQGDTTEFVATLVARDGKKFKPKDKIEADTVLSDLNGASFSVKDVKESVSSSHAPAPFITSTMQKAALSQLSMSLKRTSFAAQALYEGVNIKGEGKTALVTYIRTDSVRVSSEAQQGAREYIHQKYGEKFVPEKPNFYKSKKNAQDAHEAIRPISLAYTPERVQGSLDGDQFRLYKLIFDRFVASQMSEATFNAVSAIIGAKNYDFKAVGKTPLFAGYTAAWAKEDVKAEEAGENDEETPVEGGKIPKLAVDDALEVAKLTSTQKWTKPPARYDDAGLVDAMEKKGIGRPATYQPTIGTLYARTYIEKDGKHIVPTELGTTVCNLLVKNFPDIINVTFTADMEDKLDNIEDGGKVWQDEIADFYKSFEVELKKAGEDTEKIRLAPILSDEVCEKCGKPMAIRTGKFGKFLGCSGYPECKNIKKIEKIVGRCPDCGKDVAQKKSKKGTLFYGCTGYPSCTFLSWNIPLAEKCPKCGKHLELKKTKDGDLVMCGSKECDYKLLERAKNET